MTITYLDLYNEVTGQPWSMFDSEVEDSEEFESAVTSSIQKALGNLWCSYNYPFRSKEYEFETEEGENGYETPNGIIEKFTVNGREKYSIKVDGNLIEYNPTCRVLEPKQGTPEQFYIKNDKLYHQE